jgi:hypothetical protein
LSIITLVVFMRSSNLLDPLDLLFTASIFTASLG